MNNKNKEFKDVKKGDTISIEFNGKHYESQVIAVLDNISYCGVDGIYIVIEPTFDSPFDTCESFFVQNSNLNKTTIKRDFKVGNVTIQSFPPIRWDEEQESLQRKLDNLGNPDMSESIIHLTEIVVMDFIEDNKITDDKVSTLVEKAVWAGAISTATMMVKDQVEKVEKQVKEVREKLDENTATEQS